MEIPQQRQRSDRPPHRPTAGSTEFAADLGKLARTLQETEEPDAVLKEAVRGAIELLPPVVAGSVTLPAGPERVDVKAASSELAMRIGAVLTDLGEGPSLDALASRQTVRAARLADDERWPRFAVPVLELGVTGVLCLPLYVDDRTLGVLNLYTLDPDGFTAEDEQAGQALAIQAAVAYAWAQRTEQLLTAVETRDLIGEAVGLLMERYSIGADRALGMLRQCAHQSDRDVVDAAHELIRDAETGFRH
ncbi:ANTAR domain protein with unknown sensor [Kribbella flavida DSM 17836]|uniref:ANTAR domain-containing protein n=1 Tax=Kribbella flavida (strain DSM 17836 / JCM 10339 / NBRC 14399) TaxID=479435 RepID=D2PPY5_KRIFD|nr:GAF and ANTAR domain-containing protein [Kribbella flavida]ADB32909.1 ANTAR domain protein with unknown sensor [Kribbella flavida DSM 17836]